MRKQGKKMCQTNLHATSIKYNDSMAEGMTEREFRMYIIKTIREANKEMKEQMQALNDHNNQLVKEQIQEARDDFNKELEILKRKQSEILEMKETINQVKNSIENITNIENTWKTEPQKLKTKYLILKTKLTKQKRW